MDLDQRWQMASGATELNRVSLDRSIHPTIYGESISQSVSETVVVAHSTHSHDQPKQILRAVQQINIYYMQREFALSKLLVDSILVNESREDLVVRPE